MSVKFLTNKRRVNAKFDFFVGYDAISKLYRIELPNGSLALDVFFEYTSAARAANKMILSQFRIQNREHDESRQKSLIPSDLLMEQGEEDDIPVVDFLIDEAGYGKIVHNE